MPTFDPIFARDPGNPNNIASNATITLFDPADPTKTPILLARVDGTALPNPYTVDRQGMGPAFVHETLFRVGWEGGGFSNFFTSYEAMHEEAVAARTAAEAAVPLAQDAQAAALAAADNAAPAAAEAAAAAAETALAARVAAGEFKGEPGRDGSNVLPTSTAIAQEIATAGSPANAALSATIASTTAPIVDQQVANSLASNATPANAAAAAVENAMAAQNLSWTLVQLPGDSAQTATIIRGTPVYDTPAKFGSALSAGVIQLPNAYAEPSGNTVTVEGWFNTSVTPATVPQVILQQGPNFYFGIAAVSGRPILNLSGEGASQLTGPANVCDGAWHHFAFEYGRSAGVTTYVGFWIDGVKATGTPTITAKPYDPKLTLRSFPSSTTYDYAGRVDDLRISRGARYTSTFTPPAAAHTWDSSTLALASLDSGTYKVPNALTYPARPSNAPAGAVTYVGTAQPTGWLTNDRWIQV